MRQALSRAKKLTAELRPKNGVGGDSNDIAGGESYDDVSHLPEYLSHSPVAVEYFKEARQWTLDSGSCFDVARPPCHQKTFPELRSQIGLQHYRRPTAYFRSTAVSGYQLARSVK
jgi:hypothetical protein